MPARSLHIIYKQYIETQLNEDARRASENEAIADELEDAH